MLAKSTLLICTVILANVCGILIRRPDSNNDVMLLINGRPLPARSMLNIPLPGVPSYGRVATGIGARGATQLRIVVQRVSSSSGGSGSGGSESSGSSSGGGSSLNEPLPMMFS